MSLTAKWMNSSSLRLSNNIYLLIFITMKLKLRSIFSITGFPFLPVMLLTSLFLAQCQRKEVKKIARDVTITPKNAVTRLLIDSMELEKYIIDTKLEDSSALRLRNFYNSRNFQFAWITEKGIAEQTRVFYELDKSYDSTSRDSTQNALALRNQLSGLISKDTLIRAVSPSLVKLELELTRYFFSFVTNAYAGKVDPAALQWYIPRKKINAVALLDSLVAKKGAGIEQWEPVNRYYKTLNKELIRWYSIQKRGSWPQIDFTTLKPLKEGDSGLVVSQLKQRLIDFGDLKAGDSSSVYTAEVTAAIKKAQLQFGYGQTGKPDGALLAALNAPVESRIQQMLINLERIRWSPLMPDGKLILVNIPEYKLHVFEAKKEVLNMGIVVGKAANKTVIFSNNLKNIVFSPYWNIPPSIVRTEIQPAMRKNRNFLAQKNMEQYGFSDGLPLIRQKPGNTNSLGRVKFLFPNNYNIYLHDTPAKALFSETKRAFSHGCIRLAKPKSLAEYLLADRPEWTTEKIDKAMNSKKEVWVTMKMPVPVIIAYFTSWVDKNGLINFREDIYGHDQKMAGQLFPAK
jgi:murein L,D-transpeptidase YcbB/YkuD